MDTDTGELIRDYTMNCAELAQWLGLPLKDGDRVTGVWKHGNKLTMAIAHHPPYPPLLNINHLEGKAPAHAET